MNTQFEQMNKQGSQAKTRHRRGFTLLEVVIALGLMGMLVSMIFRVARTSVELSHIVVDGQNSTMERNAFFNLLKNHFERVPGNAVMRLVSEDSSNAQVSRVLFTLTFQNVPMSFHWGDVPMTAEAIELLTVEQRDGFIDVLLRFYDEKILAESSMRANDDIDPVAEIVLIEDLWMCDCEVVDGSTMEQLKDWDNSGRLPLQVKFYCRFDPTSDIVQQTFWIVPKQNPEVFFRQLVQQNTAQPQINPGQGNPNPGGGSNDPGSNQKPNSVPTGGSGGQPGTDEDEQ
jgi:prepilin-type N-terminal cleavage/methylation domain-containing protein